MKLQKLNLNPVYKLLCSLLVFLVCQVECINSSLNQTEETSLQNERINHNTVSSQKQQKRILSSIPSHCDSWVKVESAGAVDGNYVRFYLNDVLVHSGSGYGLYFVKLNSDGTAVEETKRFQIGSLGVSSHVNDMTTWINSIPNGRIVLAGVQGDVSIYMTPVFGSAAAYTALQSLGADSDLQFWINDAWALIGKKGSPPSEYGIKSLRAPTLFPGWVTIQECASGCGDNSKVFRVVSQSNSYRWWAEGPTFGIYEEGTKVRGSDSGTGTYIEVWDQTGQYYESKFYGQSNSNNFGTYLNTLADGFVVVAGIHRKGVYTGNDNYDDFMSCGAQDFSTVLVDQPWAVIGKKGYAPGQGHSQRKETFEAIDLQYCVPDLGCAPQCHTCQITKTNCTSCKPGSNREGGDCHCKPKFYQFGDSKDCLPCAYMCNECERYANSCKAGTGCTDPTRDTASPSCACREGFFQEGTNVTCSNCNLILCKSCETTADTCTECSHSTRNMTNGCQCNTGFYDVGIAECAECDFKCGTCVNYADECQTCSDISRNTTSPDCQCQTGFFQEVVNQTACTSCNLTLCATCDTNANICTDCSDSSRNMTNNCLCNEKTFEVTNQALCPDCDFQCGSCSGNSSNCDTCSDPSRDNSTSACGCRDGFFQEGTNETCTTCNLILCETCTGNRDSCDTCSHATRNQTNSCQCNDGFYDVGVAECAECDFKCGTCVNNADECLTCSDVSRNTTSPDCQCQTGFFQEVVNQTSCTSCNLTLCATCDTNANVCTDCSDSSRNMTNNCQCNEKTFEVTNQALCPDCDFQCGSCSGNSSNCDTCSDPTRDNSTSACGCKDGFFQEGTNETCTTCNLILCETCTGNRDSCDTCSHTTRNQTNSCQCNDGFYDVGVAECAECDFKCGTCVNNADECLTCSDVSRNTTSPDCQCQTGFFQEVVNQTSCTSCNLTLCATCDTNANICTDCSDSSRNMTNNCLCNEKTFEVTNQALCPDCDFQCGSCSGNSSNCDTCSDPTRDNSTSACGCKDGFFQEGTNETCTTCNLILCETCTGNRDSCDTCSHATRNQTNSCQCNDGFYDVGVAECAECDFKCGTCVNNSDECLTCSDVSRNTTSPDCQCQVGLFQEVANQTTCSTCNTTLCAECEGNANNCTVCSDPTRDNSNNCECLPKHFEIAAQTACGVCDFKCGSCSNNSTNCDTCSDPTRDNSTSECKCTEGFYQIASNIACTSCNQTLCKSCTGSPNSCDECSHPTRDFNNSCQCLPLHFENGGTECGQCHRKCADCSGSAGNCGTCSDSNRDPLNDCECIDGWFDNGTATCQKCDVQCEKCSGAADTCTQCSDANRDPLDNCMCNDGFFEELVANKVCGTCDKKCKTCENNSTNCTECYDNTRENYPSCTCKANSVEVGDHSCQCASGYFKKVDPTDPSQSTCEKCSSKCGECETTFDKCTSCSVGIKRSFSVSEGCGCEDSYYHKEGEVNCQECDPNCKTCEKQGECTSCKFFILSPPQCSLFRRRYQFFENAGPEALMDQKAPLEQCDIKCTQCENNSPQKCLQCQDGLNRKLITPDCVCLDGFHDDYGRLDKCKKCDSKCSKCVSEAVCTECVDGNFRQLNMISGQCECQPGYTQYGDKTKCTRCYQYKEECHLVCPPNTKQNNKDYICEDIDLEEKDNMLTIVFLGATVIATLLLTSYAVKQAMVKAVKPPQKNGNGQQPPKNNKEVDPIDEEDEDNGESVDIVEDIEESNSQYGSSYTSLNASSSNIFQSQSVN